MTEFDHDAWGRLKESQCLRIEWRGAGEVRLGSESGLMFNPSAGKPIASSG